MNTASSVAYGWGVLIVAGGVSYYMAKGHIDARRKEQRDKGQRPTEKLTWQEKIAQDERLRPVATTIHPQPTPLEVDRTSTPGMRDKANMQSAPTGVETSAKSSSVSKDQ